MTLPLLGTSGSPTFAHFLAPLLEFQQAARNQYRCHVVTDEDWIHSGLQRVIGQHDSGCDFIQKRVLRGIMNLTKSNYFESCKSPRRYKHLKGLTEDFLHHLSHLALGSDGTKKKPHDMGVLKRLDVEALRQGAHKGQKVLSIWDRAIIDFRQWSIWKNTNAIYIIFRVKENMALEHPLPQEFDREDPVNVGVLADELVSNPSGTMVRRVSFRMPETGEVMEFLTTLCKRVPPVWWRSSTSCAGVLEKAFMHSKTNSTKSKHGH